MNIFTSNDTIITINRELFYGIVAIEMNDIQDYYIYKSLYINK